MILFLSECSTFCAHNNVHDSFFSVNLVDYMIIVLINDSVLSVNFVSIISGSD